MEKSMTLESVTKLLLAAEKIKRMREETLRGDEGVSIRQDNLAVLHDAFNLISEFLPGNRSVSITEALQKSSSYSKAYREIKRHVRSEGNSKTDLSKITKAVKAVVPVLDRRQRIWFEKIARIGEILNS